MQAAGVAAVLPEEKRDERLEAERRMTKAQRAK
jgi:hypothetical protein